MRIFSIFLFILFISCERNAITGRRQLNLFPEADLQKQALTEYRSFLNKNKVIPISTSKQAEMVKRVGLRISQAITNFYNQKGLSNELAGYNWEFNLVNSPEINAWCMPGGKVVVYTGLLDVTKNENALAIVLGHEITHAVAHHGNERLSQAFIAQGIQVAGDAFTKNNKETNAVFNAVFMPGTQLGVLLPNSRNHELEADHFGIIFAAMAGYDPRESVLFWNRMNSLNDAKIPEWLATHPSNEKRIQKLNEFMDEAMSFYKP
ncbi:MAG: M48 family metallopeptidase [Sphingobacteriales bacterium]|nr:M48 family metallopeptidase [Sphingobacteriales bacterium]